MSHSVYMNRGHSSSGSRTVSRTRLGLDFSSGRRQSSATVIPVDHSRHKRKKSGQARQAEVAALQSAQSSGEKITRNVGGETGCFVRPEPVWGSHIVEESSKSLSNITLSARGSGESSSWRDYFDEQFDVAVPSGKGGTDFFRIYSAGEGRISFFCIHGASETGLSWGLVTQFLKQRSRVVTMDLRGHGNSRSSDESDFSIQRLTEDVLKVSNVLFGCSERSKCAGVILVGHSLGGAVVVHACISGKMPCLRGAIVIDIAEGTAMSSTPIMKSIVERRPREFASIDDAVSWCLGFGIRRSRTAAELCLPDELVETEDGRIVWRTNLVDTIPHWESWYSGLSSMFLRISVPTLLLIAKPDRLDTELTIAHMQGKYQLGIVPAGHFVHEDEPAKTAESFIQFAERLPFFCEKQ